MFDAIFFKAGPVGVIKFINWPRVETVETIYNVTGFVVRRQNCVEISSAGLFLPGSSDQHLEGPLWDTSHKITDKWITNYKIAYRMLNGKEPVILDLDQMTDSLATEVVEAGVV